MTFYGARRSRQTSFGVNSDIRSMAFLHPFMLSSACVGVGPGKLRNRKVSLPELLRLDKEVCFAGIRNRAMRLKVGDANVYPSRYRR